MKEFILRPWTTEDAESLQHFANNPKVANNLMDRFPHPYSLEDAHRFIVMAQSHQPVQIMAIEIEGKAAGGIGVHPADDIYRRNAELGYWIAEPYWGRGIATAAVKQITDYAFSNFDIDRIFARPFGNNLASQKILQKAGYVLEARLAQTFFKNGRYEDELIYARRRDNRNN